MTAALLPLPAGIFPTAPRILDFTPAALPPEPVAARPPSPAMQAAMAAFADHAARWNEARRDTLRQFGSDAAPCRDVRLDLAGDHQLDRNDHSVRTEP